MTRRKDRRTVRWAGLLLLLSLPVPGGCTYVADLQDFGPSNPPCDEGTELEIRDFWMELDAMSVHVGQLVEFRIIADGEEDADFLVAVARLDGLPAPEFMFQMPGAIPPGPYRLDFWADLSGNRRYDVPPADHSWSPPVCVSGGYRFTHVPTFVNIEDPPPHPVGGDFTLHLRDFAEVENHLLEVWVVADDMSGRTVGYYRLHQIKTADTTLVLPGVVELGTTYKVAFYADRNGNEKYDPPEVDLAWLLEGTADASGLEVDFTFDDTQLTDIIEYVPVSMR